MRKHPERWWPRVRELAARHPEWSEVELAWAVVDQMAIEGAAVLHPLFEASGGRRGRQTVQTNPTLYRDAARMVEQAVHLAGLAPNIQVKFPATAAGIAAVEEATFRGVNTMATVSFTVAQAVAAAEAAERGLERRAAAGLDVGGLVPIAVLMIGRLDDWMKVLVERDGLAVDPTAPDWAGIAVFKRTYALFRERGYRSRLLAAATRHPLHWTELVGADAAMTLTAGWQARFERSGLVPEPRIDVPVDPAIIAELTARIPGLHPCLPGRWPRAVRVRRLWGDRADAAGIHRVLPRPAGGRPRDHAARSRQALGLKPGTVPVAGTSLTLPELSLALRLVRPESFMPCGRIRQSLPPLLRRQEGGPVRDEGRRVDDAAGDHVDRLPTRRRVRCDPQGDPRGGQGSRPRFGGLGSQVAGPASRPLTRAMNAASAARGSSASISGVPWTISEAPAATAATASSTSYVA